MPFFYPRVSNNFQILSVLADIMRLLGIILDSISGIFLHFECCGSVGWLDCIWGLRQIEQWLRWGKPSKLGQTGQSANLKLNLDRQSHLQSLQLQCNRMIQYMNNTMQYNYFAIMLAFLLKLSFRKTFRTPLHFPSTFWPIAGRNDWRIIDRNGFSFVCKTTRTAVEAQFEIGQIFYTFHQTINFTAFSLTSTTRLKILQLLDVAAIYLLWMLSPL